MKITKTQLKQLIAEEKARLAEGGCGDMSMQGHVEMMPDMGHGSMGHGPAVQHPSYAGSGDMSMSDDHHDHEGRMALSQLQQIMQNAGMLKGLVSEDDELQAWVQSKLTKASDYLNSVRSFLEYELMPSQPVAIGLGEHRKVKFTKQSLSSIISEELYYLTEQGQSAMAQLGGQDIIHDPSMGEPSYEDVLRSTVEEAVRKLKQGDAEGALGQLQALLDGTTGGKGLDK